MKKTYKYNLSRYTENSSGGIKTELKNQIFKQPSENKYFYIRIIYMIQMKDKFMLIKD